DLKPYSILKLFNEVKVFCENDRSTLLTEFVLDDTLIENEVNVDIDYLNEALYNIVKNAEQHAENKIQILVHVEDEHLVIDVHDDGPGFSSDAMRNYQQAYFSENPLAKNSGLGLYIADRLLQLQNISMELSNLNGAMVKLRMKLL
ncbi:MAG: ATP-binding protein, partial [Gallicola sp.]|nr:ATP-binding protein [Gallicola sp.]